MKFLLTIFSVFLSVNVAGAASTVWENSIRFEEFGFADDAIELSGKDGDLGYFPSEIWQAGGDVYIYVDANNGRILYKSGSDAVKEYAHIVHLPSFSLSLPTRPGKRDSARFSFRISAIDVAYKTRSPLTFYMKKPGDDQSKLVLGFGYPYCLGRISNPVVEFIDCNLLFPRENNHFYVDNALARGADLVTFGFSGESLLPADIVPVEWLWNFGRFSGDNEYFTLIIPSDAKSGLYKANLMATVRWQ